MRRIAPLLVLLLAGCAAAPAQQQQTVTVFAAASLTEAFDELALRFEAANPGVDVVLSYGGSSALATQIGEGAPADVFAAASEDAMQPLTDVYEVFATNTLQLAVPIGNPAGVEALADLAEPSLVLALCAPEVPCGAASQALFEAAGLAPVADTYEQDVKAVLTKVELGEVDAGLVYRTDVRSADVEGIALPEAEDVVNRYPITALTPAGGAFADYVRSAERRAVLDRLGFGAP